MDYAQRIYHNNRGIKTIAVDKMDYAQRIHYYNSLSEKSPSLEKQWNSNKYKL